MSDFGKVLTFGLSSLLMGNGNDAKNAAQANTQATNAAIAEKQTADAAAAQGLKDAQATASTQAQARLKAKTSGASQSVYTSPLGISGTADTAKKLLLGQ